METHLTAMHLAPNEAYVRVLRRISAYAGPTAFMQAVAGQMPTENQSRGRVFELAFCEVLKREGVMPFYYQVRFTLRPIIDFDILLFERPSSPWSFSLKTSFRERWKQAYLEAIVLKSFYPRSKVPHSDAA